MRKPSPGRWNICRLCLFLKKVWDIHFSASLITESRRTQRSHGIKKMWKKSGSKAGSEIFFRDIETDLVWLKRANMWKLPQKRLQGERKQILLVRHRGWRKECWYKVNTKNYNFCQSFSNSSGGSFSQLLKQSWNQIRIIIKIILNG